MKQVKYQHVYTCNVKTSRYGTFVHLHDFKLTNNKEKYYRDRHYTILVLIKRLKIDQHISNIIWHGVSLNLPFFLDLYA